MARSLAGPAQGSRRPGLEGGGPKTGKVATNPGVGSGPNLGTTRSWSNAARKLEKRDSRQRPAAADDWKNQYLSIISIVLKTACPSTPRSAAPGCLFCRRPLTRRRRRPAVPLVAPPTPTRRPTGCPVGRRRLPGPPVSTGCSLRSLLPAGLSGVPPRRRRPAVPLVAPSVAAASAGCPAGRSFPPASREFLPADADPSPPGAAGLDWLPPPPAAPSRRTLGSSSPPTPTRRLPGPPVSTGCPAGRRRLSRLLRRPLLPVGLSGVPPRRRRPAVPLVAPSAASSRRPLGSSSPPTPTRRLPGPPVSTGCPAGRRRLSRLLRRPLLPVGLSGVPPRRRRPAVPLVAPSAASSRRPLGSSSPPTPTRRLPGPPVSTGCPAGRFFPPAIPIDPPVSPFAGPPRRTGGVCLPFGRNGGRKCRSRLEYCAEFPSFVTPKHQYHEKPPPRTLCVCGLLQCSAGRMLRA